MRRAFFGLLFALVGTCVALILSSSAAGASTDLTDGLDQSQTGQNSNTTDQQSEAAATTKQLNLNLPISLLSPGSNSGDVDQSNDADTTVISANENDSTQSVDQTQQGSVEGSDKGHDSCGCGHKSKNGHDGGESASQSQQAANTNETSQDSSAEATTYQANVNLPVAILSPGANSGDVDQSNKADTYVASYNKNDSTQSVDQTQQGSVEGSDKGASTLTQAQQAANTNETSQDSSAEATTKQANVNAPISILGFGLNGSKDAHGMRRGYERPSSHDGSGDVDQSNKADTYVVSYNQNDSTQSVDQTQQGSVEGPAKGHDPCRCRHGHDGKGHDGKDDHESGCGCDHKGRGHDNDHKGRGHGHDKGHCGCHHGDRGHLSQNQEAANTNETTQDSSAEATTKQANVNTPFSFLGFGHGRNGNDDPKGRCGCDHKDKGNSYGRPNGGHGKTGDVGQSNEADTYVASVNSNDSWQSIDQIQQGWVNG